MSDLIGAKISNEEDPKPLEPVQSDVDVTEGHFKQSLLALDQLALHFEHLGTELANKKKKSNLRVLKAILFESEETEKTFGKKEEIMLDLCRKIMYHRQIVEIYLMKKENDNLVKELKDG